VGCSQVDQKNEALEMMKEEHKMKMELMRKKKIKLDLQIKVLRNKLSPPQIVVATDGTYQLVQTAVEDDIPTE